MNIADLQQNGNKLSKTDDFLQKRLALLLQKAPQAQAINGADEVWLASDIGKIRRQNQDRALYIRATYALAPERSFALAVLSDGMGGLVDGDLAATMCASVFTARVLRTSAIPNEERLRSASIAASNAVYEVYGGRAGATLSAVMVDQRNRSVGVNVGDSRIYLMSAANGFRQLSTDDTLAAVLGQEDEAASERNHLVQYIGMGEGLEPHIVRIENTVDSYILLTSDGVHGTSPQLFPQIVKSSSTDRSELLRRLLCLSSLSGGRDNATVVTMPSCYSQSAIGVDQGLAIEFWSAYERLEVWLPILADAPGNRLQGELNNLQTVPSPPAHVTPSASVAEQQKLPSVELPSKVTRSRTARRRRKVYRKIWDTPDYVKEELPLDDEGKPVLDVDFPTEREK